MPLRSQQGTITHYYQVNGSFASQVSMANAWAAKSACKAVDVEALQESIMPPSQRVGANIGSSCISRRPPALLTYEIFLNKTCASSRAN